MTHPTILAPLDLPAQPATMFNRSDLATFFTVDQEHVRIYLHFSTVY
jgi:hypothetical protein